MKNRYTTFLLYSCAMVIALILVIQIYGLTDRNLVISSGMPYSRIRLTYGASILLSIMAVSLLFSKEEINRGLKRKAYTDITGIMNKHACLERMTMLDCNDSTLKIGFALFDLNNLKKVNDFYGHEQGDKLIQNFVSILRQASDEKYFLGRFGGDEFVTIIENCDEGLIEDYLDRVRELTDRFNNGRTIRLSYASGYAVSTREHYYLMDDLLKEADKKMYENKKMIKSLDMDETGQISKILDMKKNVLSDRDELTELYGYKAFMSIVRKVLQFSGSDAHLAIVCLDINNFGYVNDIYGRREGDNILKRLAAELNSQTFCLCAHRLYSDNFTYLADISGMSREEGMEMIQNWNKQFSRLANEAYKGARFIVKSGIYFISDPCETVETMINNAHYAHKSSKTSHQDIAVYCEALGQAAKKRSDIIHSFQNALEQNEFEVYVQPQVSCGNKNICGVEALVRWKRADGAFVYPGEFIPILEQTGDIVELDFYVYERVFAYLSGNESFREKNVPISVNVSRVHLLEIDRFIARLKELGNRYPVSSRLIVFELTESAYIQDIDDSHTFIRRIHELGYKVSMDDFGNGYSSLKAIQSLPFDEIKFDRAFLDKNADEKEPRTFLQLIGLIKGLGISVVCEGAETEEHVRLLERSECDSIQGYYYYKPFPLKELKIQEVVKGETRQTEPAVLCG
ncbi:MAG: EAL domain-containing protein [Lacrimispora sp.]|uniref:bifunctional diguanylate cyclase/phosphodiesterase n=1 Tax=Lacrimispora sp. TaxID=2719234 RepID=UPI0039E5EB11